MTLRVRLLSLSVTSPRFHPRDFCVNPKRFGKFAEPGWKPAHGYSRDTRDQFGAAVIQNKVAVAMRAAIKEKYRTSELYAEAIQMESTRLSRLLSGRIVMRLEDVASATNNLGIRVQVADRLR